MLMKHQCVDFVEAEYCNWYFFDNSLSNNLFEIEWKMEKHHSSSHCASASVKHTLSFTPSYQSGRHLPGEKKRSRYNFLHSK